MKQKTKSLLAKVLVCAFASSLLIGGLPLIDWQSNVDALTETVEVKPYVEYTFEDSTDFYKNTGSSASTKDYTLSKYGNGDIQRTGYVEFAENSTLYLPQANNVFTELTDFTITVDVNAGKPGGWYGSIFSWDSFTNIGSNSSLDKYNRLDTKYTSGADWIRFGDTQLKGGSAQWASYTSGAALYTGDSGATKSGLVTLVYSLEAGSTLTIKAYSEGTQVGALSYDISSWSLYNASSTYKMFMIGGCYDTRYFTSGSSFTPAQKAVGTMDNIRIYDFAMTEAQMSEYATNKKIETEVEIPDPTYTADIAPYVEYTFEDSTDFYKNTGSSANTKDYTLTKTGSNDVQIGTNTYAYLDNQSTLYLPTGNNPFTELTDFTITVDVDAKRSGWYSSIFSWDAITTVTSSSDIDKYTRICVRNATSENWMRFSDRVLTANSSGSQWDSYAKGAALYNGDLTATSTGWLTLVMSVDVGGSIKVQVYDANKTKVGEYVNDDLGDWTLYPESSTFKMFTIGGCMDSRSSNFNASTGKPINPQQPMRGGLDNIRIYDFAMTEAQMQEYATNKKLTASGVQIEESENGTVTVDNYTPAVGEEVVFNVTPDDGYELSELKVNGETIEAVDGVYKTTMIYDGLYVQATFAETFAHKLNAVSMTHGATVRYGGTAAYTGLRFRMEVSKADYEAIAAATPEDTEISYGILIIPAEYRTKYGEFTVENLFGGSVKYHLAERDSEGNMIAYTGNLPQIMNFWTEQLYYNETLGEYEYFGSITNIKDKNLTKAFVGVGVIKTVVNGETTTYALVNYANGNIANNTRSIYQVAKMVAEDESVAGNIQTWIKTNYIDKVENAVSALSGKKLSVLGDSISTYSGVSNDATANTTIGENEVFYNANKGLTVDDTWWKQTATNNGMEVLVNNSWSGSNVATNYGNETKGGCTDRAVNLHDDVDDGVDNGTPDIIAVYMGINDCGCLTDLGEFDEIADVWDGTQYVGDTEKFATAYATMIHKITTAYSAADVFLFTLPRNGYLWLGTKEEYNALQDEYNKMIYKIAEVFGCQVVDLATTIGENYEDYVLGGEDVIHPNAEGMDIITAAFETALYTYYTSNVQ